MSKEILTLNSQTVIGMVHCLPLPTTAGFDGDYQRIIDRAVQDAVTLEKAGVDAVIVENMGDTVLFTDGIIQPCAKKCMEYRKMMGQENVKILADVQVKHAHMLREHITIEQSAKDAASNGADGIIVTGTQVGE